MENELKLLRKIQDYDLEIEEIEEESELQQASLAEQEALFQNLSEGLDVQRAKLEETRTLMRQKKIELQENDDDSHSHKDKQARVSSARELSAIEKEIESLRRRRAQLDEEYETLSDAVSDAEDDVGEKQEKVEALEKELEEQRDVVERGTRSATRRIRRREKDREALVEEFPKASAAIARYEFIGTRLAGRVIVAASNNACSGCNMVIPPQIYNELQIGEKVIQCPSCKRILYYEEQAAE